MTKTTNPSSYDQNTITPHLIIKDAAKAIEFYKKAFAAEECTRITTSDGKIMHANLKIGNSHFFIADERPVTGNRWLSPQSLNGANSSLHLSVPDVDKTFAVATAAGANVEMPPQDMFWGDRYARVIDPFGQPWSIGTHKEDVTPQEMQKRADEFIKQMAACAK